MGSFEKMLIPELNLGQLLVLVRHRFPEIATRTIGLHKVKGQPFKVAEIAEKIKEVLKEKA